jgi:hypothetical protein
LPHLNQADATRQGVPARRPPVTWLRAFGEVVRSGLTIEETRQESLLALRTVAGVALVIGSALWLVSPAYAASAALGAYSTGGATFSAAATSLWGWSRPSWTTGGRCATTVSIP